MKKGCLLQSSSQRGRLRTVRLSLALIIALPGFLVTVPAGALARTATRYVPTSTTLSWMRVSPADAHTLFAGGKSTVGDNQYQAWLMRSTDAGTTWSDFGGPAGLYTRQRCGDGTCVTEFGFDPITLGADGAHLYATGSTGGGSPASDARLLFVSRDGGLSWEQSDVGAGDTQYGGGPLAIFLSPVNDGRLYVLNQDNGTEGAGYLTVSSDAGHTWSNPEDLPFSLDPQAGQVNVQNLVPDPLALDTIYVNMTTDSGSFAARSENAGLSWTVVLTPTVTPAITSFTVGTDPLEPGLLVGHGSGDGVPVDRVFLSSDHGRTWQAAPCPGDFAGHCPAFTLAAGLGAGHHYALFPDGVHAFDGVGPSGPRLALSDRLPIQPAAITDVEGGRRNGDPVYLLSSGQNGPVTGVLYRSVDAGASWQRLAAGLFPPVRPPTAVPGSLVVPHARFGVDPHFIPAYRRLGVFLTGLPITDAYYEGTTLTQDFEHMRLVMRGKQAAIANLGTLVQAIEQGVDYGGNCDGCVEAVPSTATRLFFGNGGTQGYTLSGAFLRFWRAHGGMAVFGAPLSQPYRADNGDGSGHTYTMQLFERARLELHPQNKNPAYQVELGLLGDQYLVDIGWLHAA